MHITKEVIMQVIEHNSYIHSFAGTLVISYKELYSRIGKRVPHSENNIYGWEPNIFSTQINFDNPILLCLGGAGIDDDKLANGIAKLAQELIGRTDINDKEIQLLSAVYPKNIEMQPFEMVPGVTQDNLIPSKEVTSLNL